MGVERGEAPAWLEEFARSFRAGESHAFLLHGDVDGTTLVGDVALRNRALLTAQLRQAREVVAIYSLAGGIEIVGGEELIPVGRGREITRRARALELIGYEQPAQPAGAQFGMIGGDLAAMIGGMGPQGGGGNPFEQAQSPGDALRLLGRLLRSSGKLVDGREIGTAAVIIDHADALVPAPAMAGKGAMSPADRLALVVLAAIGQDTRVGTVGNPIFLICRDLAELHPDLRAADSGWKAISIALPDRDARASYLAWFLAEREGRGKPIVLDGLTVGEVANLTAGLSLRNIEDVLLVAYTSGGLTRALLREHKDAIIKASYSDIAEMLEPLPGGFDQLGGMDELKGFLREQVIGPLQRGDVEYAIKALLLVGPPGTGKTYLMRALAKELGFTGVQLNVGNLLGQYVGQSEGALRKFFTFCRSLAPVLIFCDELDQSDIARRGGGSGNPVASNLFNAVLQFLSDETLRGKVLFAAASNRPDLIDDAMKRPGRLGDAIVPVLLPDEDERRGILAAQMVEHGLTWNTQGLIALGRGTEDWSAADLAALVRKLRMKDGPGEVSRARAQEALTWLSPRGAQKARYFTMLALQSVDDPEFVPARYRGLLGDRGTLEREVRESKAGFADLAGAGRAERE